MKRIDYEQKDLGYSFGVAVAVMLVASVVRSFIFGQSPTGWKYWIQQTLYTLLIGGSAIFYALITKTKFFTATKLNVKPNFAHLGWGILMTACLIFLMMPINVHLMDGFEAMGLKRPQTSVPDSLSDLPGLIIVASVLPAFCEELVFRGTVARSASSLNKPAALAICGALFAVFHANPAQTIHQFVLGAILALVALRSGSLWPSIFMHMFNNGLVVGLHFTPLGQDEFWRLDQNTAVALPLMLAGLVGFVLGVFGYLKTTKSAWQSDDDAQTMPTSSIVTLIFAALICLLLWITILVS